MPRIKSLIEQIKIDTAHQSHDCQGNSRHRIKMGDARLKVKNGRGWDHYCLSCAETIVSRDIQELTSLQGQLAQRPHRDESGAV